jgi:crossover junction endodeoxyribonuclease RusA
MTTTAAPVIEIELPYPPKALSPNARVDYHVLMREKANYKNNVYLLARNARQLAKGTFPLKSPVTVIVTFILPDRIKRDWDNALSSFKAGFDGIVEAGILADDNMTEIRLGLECEYAKGKAAVRVRLQGS